MQQLKLKDNLTSLELVEQINFFRNEFDNKKELQHKSLLAVIRDEFSEEINEQKFLPVEYKDKKGELRPMFILTLSQAKQVLVRESKAVRKAVIKYIEELEEKLKNPYNVPMNYKDALLQLVEKTEEIEKLETKIQEQAPKVLFADAVSTSTTTILVGELAKILKQNGVETGQKRLFEWLRNNGYLIKREGSEKNLPTQRAMELGLFEIKESTHLNSDGSIRITKTTKVTGKGQRYFINKFLNDKMPTQSNILYIE